MALTTGTNTIGPDHGTLLIRTTREGAAAKVGHDLTLEAARWSATVVVDAEEPARSSVTATVDAASLEVREAHGGAIPLSLTSSGARSAPTSPAAGPPSAEKPWIPVPRDDGQAPPPANPEDERVRAVCAIDTSVESFIVLEGSTTIELPDTGQRVELRGGSIASFDKGTRSIWTFTEPFKKFTVISE